MNMHHAMIDPGDPLGVAVVIVGAIGTLWTFVLAFRMSIWPGETEPDHPKNVIFREDR